jgi:hypothetical protein
MSLTLILSFPFFSFEGSSVFIDEFTGGKEVIVTFESGGIDGKSVEVEIPVNASILDAKLKITGIKHNGKYPANVTVNIGNDEDSEWEFKGTGYGAMGEQTYFRDGDSKKYLKFVNTSVIYGKEIMLPRNATIKSTSMTLEGGTGWYNEEFFVTVDYPGNKISYIKSNGDGTFDPPSSIDTGLGYYHWGAVTMGDFDNDGDLDVIGSDGRLGNLYFYEKNGLGNSFKAKVNIGKVTTSNYVYDFATADFNNDGNYDFVTNGNSATLNLFLGNGDGTFTSSTVSSSGGPSGAYSKAASDFNNDGNMDLIVGGWGTRNRFWYYQGNGDGTFQSPVAITMPSILYYSYAVMAGDFNNDGNADALAAYYNQPHYFFEGNGDGTFKTGIVTTLKTNSYSYNGGDAWDYNKDGNIDAVVCDSSWGSGLKEAYYFKGFGDGTFDSMSTPMGDIGRCYGGSAPPPQIIGAENPTVDVGNDSVIDWEYTEGILENEIVQMEDFTQKLNNLLKQPQYKVKRDKYGTDFVYIPMKYTSQNDGLLRTTRFKIEYDYTATMYEVGLDNIVSELNEHIVYTSSDTLKLHFIVASSNAGKLKFSDLELLYNIPPDMNSKIPTLFAYEDTENFNLADLSEFFTDTDETSVGLNYSIVYNSKSEHVEVFTNNSNILKFRPITPNWYGETEVMAQVIDSGLKKSYSNLFKIVVQPVNDEPTIKHQIPDVTLIEGGKEFSMDLDLKEYFTDIENDYLYYSLFIDPMDYLNEEQKNIKAFLEDNTIINVKGIGDFNTDENGVNIPIPIWVYCDDDVDINTLDYGYKNYTRQEILISILPVNDPPQWQSIPTVYVEEDNTINVNLHDYLTDDESPLSELSIQVLSNPNPSIKVDITGGQMMIHAPDDYYGSTIITLRASEPNPEFKADTALEIKITPVNDEPTITITSHTEEYQTISNIEKIKGTVYDIEANIQLVEVKIDATYASADAPHFDWQQAIIDQIYNNWTYVWDTTTVPDGIYLLTARVYDGELMDETAMQLTVENGKNIEPVVDITNPTEDAIVNGSVVIRGTVRDPDNNGINDLQIRIGREMDWTKISLEEENGTIEWFYIWDSTQAPDGDIVISGKAYDGRSWSAPLNIKVDVKNGQNATEVKDPETSEETPEIDMVWLGIIIMIVVVIIIGLMVVAVIVSKGKKRMQEYVPDGRMEPLENVEAELRPALGVGPAAAQHAALPAAGTTSQTIGVAALPAAGVTSITPTAPTLPSASQPVASVPALPPAGGSGYGLYSPQTQAATPVSVSPAGSYQPATTVTPTTPITAATTSPTQSATSTSPASETEKKE